MTFYPGSKQRTKTWDSPAKKLPPVSDDRQVDLGRPKTFTVNGELKDFYTVGALALALNRQSGTIRKWEAEGIIPVATFILPSSDKRGQRRLYTEEQIMGLREIARAEGILEPSAGGRWPDVNTTQFKARALELWKQLEGT